MIGYIAGIIGILSFIPQIIKLLRTRKSEDISLLMMIFIGISVFLWIIYGITISSGPVIYINIILESLILFNIILIIRWKS